MTGSATWWATLAAAALLAAPAGPGKSPVEHAHEPTTAAATKPAKPLTPSRTRTMELEFIERHAGIPRGLSPSEDGGYDYRDPEKRFDAHIQPDGAVSFVVALPLAAGFCLAGVCPSARAVKRQGGTRNVERGLDTVLGLDLAPAPVGFMVAFDVMPPPTQGMGEFLRRTFEMRVAMAVDWNQQQIDRQLVSLDRELLQLWSDASIPLTERKRIVFDRWEECGSGLPGPTKRAEQPPEGLNIEDEPELAAAVEGEVNRARRIAGKKARRIIEAFLRRHAAPGSDDAYGASELKRLNTARTDRFDPYRKARRNEGPTRPARPPASPPPRR